MKTYLPNSHVKKLDQNLIAKIAVVKNKIIRSVEIAQFDVKVKGKWEKGDKSIGTAHFILIKLCQEGLRHINMKGIGEAAVANM